MDPGQTLDILLWKLSCFLENDQEALPLYVISHMAADMCWDSYPFSECRQQLTPLTTSHIFIRWKAHLRLRSHCILSRTEKSQMTSNSLNSLRILTHSGFSSSLTFFYCHSGAANIDLLYSDTKCVPEWSFRFLGQLVMATLLVFIFACLLSQVKTPFPFLNFFQHNVVDFLLWNV